MKHPILDKIYEAHNFLSAIESAPRDYGTGEELYASEIHTLTAVAEKSGSNMTEIASSLNISKPALSKFVRKLENKGYLQRVEAEYNAKEFLLQLTEKGKTAVSGHRRFEKLVFGPLIKAENELSESERETVLGFLSRLTELTK